MSASQRHEHSAGRRRCRWSCVSGPLDDCHARNGMRRSKCHTRPSKLKRGIKIAFYAFHAFRRVCAYSLFVWSESVDIAEYQYSCFNILLPLYSQVSCRITHSNVIISKHELPPTSSAPAIPPKLSGQRADVSPPPRIARQRQDRPRCSTWRTGGTGAYSLATFTATKKLQGQAVGR